MFVLGVRRDHRLIVDFCDFSFETWLNARELDSFQHECDHCRARLSNPMGVRANPITRRMGGLVFKKSEMTKSTETKTIERHTEESMTGLLLLWYLEWEGRIGWFLVVDCCDCIFEQRLNVRELDCLQHKATQVFAADDDSENKSRKYCLHQSEHELEFSQQSPNKNLVRALYQIERDVDLLNR
jgi:hypothetical protein